MKILFEQRPILLYSNVISLIKISHKTLYNKNISYKPTSKGKEKKKTIQENRY